MKALIELIEALKVGGKKGINPLDIDASKYPVKSKPRTGQSPADRSRELKSTRSDIWYKLRNHPKGLNQGLKEYIGSKEWQNLKNLEKKDLRLILKDLAQALTISTVNAPYNFKDDKLGQVLVTLYAANLIAPESLKEEVRKEVQEAIYDKKYDVDLFRLIETVKGPKGNVEGLNDGVLYNAKSLPRPEYGTNSKLDAANKRRRKQYEEYNNASERSDGKGNIILPGGKATLYNSPHKNVLNKYRYQVQQRTMGNSNQQQSQQQSQPQVQPQQQVAPKQPVTPRQPQIQPPVSLAPQVEPDAVSLHSTATQPTTASVSKTPALLSRARSAVQQKLNQPYIEARSKLTDTSTKAERDAVRDMGLEIHRQAHPNLYKDNV